MKLSFHVANIPCPEEYYMGVTSHYDAYEVDIPNELFPKGLLDAMNNHGKENPGNRFVCNIAIYPNESS